MRSKYLIKYVPISVGDLFHPNPSLHPVFVAVGVERSQEGDASDENDEAEFFDAMEDSHAFITVTTSGDIQHK